MENEIEILKNWLDDATQIWILKYEWTYTDRVASGYAKNPALHREAVDVFLTIERAVKTYLKALSGQWAAKKVQKIIAEIKIDWSTI